MEKILQIIYIAREVLGIYLLSVIKVHKLQNTILASGHKTARLCFKMSSLQNVQSEWIYPETNSTQTWIWAESKCTIYEYRAYDQG